jgi:hypothetical protein
VLIIGSAHLIGVIETLRQWATLKALLDGLVYYILASNLILSLIAIGVLTAIWFHLRQTRWLIWSYFFSFILFYWLDRMVFFQSRDDYRLPFVIVFQIVIGLVLWLGLSRKSVKGYFGEPYA